VAELTEPGPGAPRGSRYADQRPYVVSERLDELNGPITGQVVLNRRLDWSGRARYDLDNPRRLASMYETVLREATTTEDLQLVPDQEHRVELVANWRAHAPVEMQIGPVLHPDDVMAGNPRLNGSAHVVGKSWQGVP
jgi:hypothetical protein